MRNAFSALAAFTIGIVLTQAAPETAASQDKAEEKIPSAKLPAAAGAIQPCKGGELLAIKLSGLKLLGIVDVKKQSLVKTLKANGADYLFAAGGSRALIYDPTGDIFTVYDLDTFERKLAKKSPFAENVGRIIMPSNVGEFALVSMVAKENGFGSGKLFRLDIERMEYKEIECKGELPYAGSSGEVRISPDGTVVTGWNTSVSPSGIYIGKLSGTKLEMSRQHSSAGVLLPLPGKDLVLASSGGVYGMTGNIIKNHQGQVLFPDLSGNFYLGVAMSGWERNQSAGKVSVFLSNDHQVIASFNINARVDLYGRQSMDLLPISDQKVLITLSDSRQEVLFRPFDPFGDLAKSNLDYLLVTSNPPKEIKAGTKMTYEVKTLTNGKKVSLELMDAPKEAKIEGMNIIWDVPATATAPGEFLVKVSNDNGEDTFHSFKVNIQS